MEQIEDYKKWLMESLGVNNMDEETELCMDYFDFIESIIEFEKRFCCIVEEDIHKPEDFETLNDFVNFLVKFNTKKQ